jgi:hypothetical protein
MLSKKFKNDPLMKNHRSSSETVVAKLRQTCSPRFKLLANSVAFALVHIILYIIVKFRGIPTENAKLSSSSQGLRESRMKDIKISYKKFHTSTIYDNQGVQHANYLGSDQITGPSITGVYFSDDYGHGREYFAVSISINDKGQDQLLMRKITGDGKRAVLTPCSLHKSWQWPRQVQQAFPRGR